MSNASAVAKYLAEIGAKGGKASGKCKRRGGADYYRKLALRRVKLQRQKAA